VVHVLPALCSVAAAVGNVLVQNHGVHILVSLGWSCVRMHNTSKIYITTVAEAIETMIGR
jgi:hypothetical protein